MVAEEGDNLETQMFKVSMQGEERDQLSRFCFGGAGFSGPGVRALRIGFGVYTRRGKGLEFGGS